jgi:hypothetical protein
MVISRSNTSYIHWNYFLALEEDLDRLSRYVDLVGNNDHTYSIEIARLLLSASSEVDVVLKQLAKKHNPSSRASRINSYYPEIIPYCPIFINFEVLIPRYGLSLQPWINWSANNPPIWWQDHNKVKHNRDQYFDRANLKNCINSIAGLFVAVLHLYAEAADGAELLQLPKLFNVADSIFGGVQMGRYGHSFRYRLL